MEKLLIGCALRARNFYDVIKLNRSNLTIRYFLPGQRRRVLEVYASVVSQSVAGHHHQPHEII